MTWGALGGAALGAGVGLFSSRKSDKNATAQQKAAIEAAKMDPRFERMLWGDGTPENQGLLARYMASGNAPQLEGLKQFGTDQSNYIGQNGMTDMNTMRGAANGLMGSNIAAPQMQSAQMQTALNGPAAQANLNQGEASMASGLMSQGGQAMGAQAQAFQSQAAQAAGPAQVNPFGAEVLWNSGEAVNAPAQNSMNLTGAYDKFINSAPGQNPMLKQGIDGAIGMNRLGFNQMLDDSTRNLQENVLPGIGSNAILAGQYGGSRQGIAEGRAVGDMAREQSRAASMFGQNATNAGVAAQAQAYDSDSNRALSATQGLGAQQYGVAQQNSAQAQQANLANQNAGNAASMFNASQNQNASSQNSNLGQQNSQFNAGLTQQTGLANQGALNNNSQFNAGQSQANSQFNAGLGQANSQFNANQGNNLSQFNSGQQNGMSQFNIGQSNNMSQYNTGLTQQNNQFNTSQTNSGNQYNAGLMQQGLLANQQSQQNTNQLNSANQLGGLGANSGLLSTALQGAQNQDSYGLNRNAQMLGMVGSLSNRQNAPVAQPLYQNTAGNVLGGAMAGLGLYQQFRGGSQPPAAGAGSQAEYNNLWGNGMPSPRPGG